VTPQLAHGDYSPSNVLFEGTDLRGVLDWESAKSGPPAIDLSWWDRLTDPPVATDAILSAYRRVRPIDPEPLGLLRRLCRLRIRVGHFAWTAASGRPRGAEAVAGLAEALAVLG